MDISVITPFYKGNHYLEGLFSCIRECAKASPQFQIELLLVNDSPDCQMEYNPDWIDGFTLRTLTNAKNCGIHRSRVNALAVAQGEYIQFLDQDDLLEPSVFLTQVPLLKNADVAIANGIDQNPRNPGKIYKNAAHHQLSTIPDYYYSVGNQIVSPGHTLIRKNAIPKAWCETFIANNGSDDLLLWLMMFAQNARFTVNPNLLYTHVDTGINVSSDNRKILRSSQEVLEVMTQFGGMTKKQARQFRRSRAMSLIHANKPKVFKILSMLCYPDVALNILKLRHIRHSKNS